MSPNAGSSRPTPIALIVSLGGKPQIATFMLEALRARGHLVDRLHVLHLSTQDPRMQRSLDALRVALRNDAGDPPVALETHPIRPVKAMPANGTHPLWGEPILTVDDPRAPDAIWMTGQALIARLRNEGCALHLCVTGGPRLIGIQMMSVASLMFGGGDEVWHLYTPPDLRERAGEGAVMSAPGQVRLVRVPLLPLGALAPALRVIAFSRPEDVIEAGQRRLSMEQRARCRQVIAGLAPRERDALQAFAAGARTNAEAAKRLGVKVSTLGTYTGKIYGLCREAWGDAPDARLSHQDLRERFRGLPAEVWT